MHWPSCWGDQSSDACHAHAGMTDQQAPSLQLDEQTDLGSLSRVPRNASTASLHSMGGDPIWNAAHGELEALNHLRPDQVGVLQHAGNT